MKKVTTKIVHIPYVEFTRNETRPNYINIGPIEITDDTIIETKINHLVDKSMLYSYMFVFGWYYRQTVDIFDKDFAQRYGYIYKEVSTYRKNEWEALCEFEELTDDQDDTVVRITNENMIIGNITRKLSPYSTLRYYENYCLGCANPDSLNIYKGRMYYFRIERKNSLYRHLLPCVRIYNIVDDDNNIIQEKLVDYGFFETVTQSYYIANPNSLPAFIGDELLPDYSNLVDINGNIIDL